MVLCSVRGCCIIKLPTSQGFPSSTKLEAPRKHALALKFILLSSLANLSFGFSPTRAASRQAKPSAPVRLGAGRLNSAARRRLRDCLSCEFAMIFAALFACPIHGLNTAITKQWDGIGKIIPPLLKFSYTAGSSFLLIFSTSIQ